MALVALTLGACGGATTIASTATPGDADAGDDATAKMVDGEPTPAPPPPTKDAGAGEAPKPPPAFLGIPELAACRGTPYEIHVVRTDLDGGVLAWGVDGTRGTWGGRVISGVVATLDVTAGQGWTVMINDDEELVPQQYVVGDRQPRIAIGVDPNAALRCSKYDGTFTIVDIGRSTPGDQAALTRLVVHFDLVCVADQAKVRGCVRYGI